MAANDSSLWPVISSYAICGFGLSGPSIRRQKIGKGKTLTSLSMNGSAVITMTASSGGTRLKEKETTEEAKRQQSLPQEDEHFCQSSHSGLSALLNAVSLQLSKADENQDEETGLDSTSTPNIVPEGGEEPKPKLAFPQALMTALMDPTHDSKLTFLPDGKYFCFSETQMTSKFLSQYCQIKSYDDFLAELSKWGYKEIATKRPGIKVFRHKMFRKGDWDLCESMLLVVDGDESSSRSRKSSISDGDASPRDTGGATTVKRRLSPTSNKIEGGSAFSKIRVEPASENGASMESVARSITSQKLQIKEEAAATDTSQEMVQQAVVGATHTIVTDAIQALLMDEDHTRKTFKKYEEELSKASLPGLVPISRELFHPGPNNRRTSLSTETIRQTPHNPTVKSQSLPTLSSVPPAPSVEVARPVSSTTADNDPEESDDLKVPRLSTLGANGDVPLTTTNKDKKQAESGAVSDTES